MTVVYPKGVQEEHTRCHRILDTRPDRSDAKNVLNAIHKDYGCDLEETKEG